MAERKRQVCLSCIDEEQEIVLHCSSDDYTHSLCAKCVVVWLRSKQTSEPFNYNCPLYNECHAELDPDLVIDVALQVKDDTANNFNVESLKSIEISAAMSGDEKVSCPNCPYFYIADDLPESYVQLFLDCPKCLTSFCLTCRHSLSQHGYLDHLCAVESVRTHAFIRHELAEVLTNATVFRCIRCKQSSAPGTKREGDCNVIKCSRCLNNYCYICSKDLGLEDEGAHRNFPHRNESIPDAKWCWLVDTDDHSQHEATDLKKIDQVIKYFNGLNISKSEKCQMIACCADLLGDLQDRILQCVDDAKKLNLVRFLQLLKRRK